MNQGNVEQIDTPMAVYDRPKTLFVNTFIGQANLLSGTVLRLDADSTLIGLANDRTLLLPRRLSFTLGSKLTITFRPEEARLSTQPSESTLPVRMTVSVPLGPSLVHEILAAFTYAQMALGGETGDGYQIGINEFGTHCGKPYGHIVRPGDLINLYISNVTYRGYTAQTARMNLSVSVQQLTVEAALTRNRERIYQAALLDPHTSAELSPDQIWNLVDDLIDAHGDLLPRYQ